MRKLFFVATLAALTIGCKQQTNTFTIQGSLADTTGSNGKMVFLTNQANWQHIDTCIIKEGQFSFQGNIDSLALLVVQHEDFYIDYIPENGITRITLREDHSVVSGTPLNETLQTYIQECDTLYAVACRKMVEIRADSSLNKELRTSNEKVLWDKFSADLHAIRENYFKANSSNNVGLYVLENMVSRDEITTLAQLDEYLNQIDPRIAKFEGIQWTRNRMIGAAATQVGTPFVDFDGFLPDGTAAKLSDFVGKGNYVLIDFWSTGCPPCIDGLPMLKELYAKYKAKGFVLLGMNDRDNKQNVEWAIQEYGMSWPLICTFGDDTPTEKYGVVGIPFIMLFAPDGKIIARDIYDEEITKKLAEVYGDKI